MSIYDEAMRDGVTFYNDPEWWDTYTGIDPLIRPICEQINRSGWCWTGESCQGHPGERHAWAGNTSPMLRLVCRKLDLGRMLAILAESLATVVRPDGGAVPCRLYSWKQLTVFAEMLVYLDATSVEERDPCLRVWAEFARRVEAR